MSDDLSELRNEMLAWSELSAASFLAWEATLPPNEPETPMDTHTCGTSLPYTLTTTPALKTSTSYVHIGDPVPSTSSFSYTYPWPYIYPQTYGWTYTYTDPRVSELEAKVETLEKMLAALLSGRDVAPPKRRRKRNE